MRTKYSCNNAINENTLQSTLPQTSVSPTVSLESFDDDLQRILQASLATRREIDDAKLFQRMSSGPYREKAQADRLTRLRG